MIIGSEAAPRTNLLQFDLDIYACGQRELHESFHSLCGRIVDVYKSLVRSEFELLEAVLILVNRAKDGDYFLLSGERQDFVIPRQPEMTLLTLPPNSQVLTESEEELDFYNQIREEALLFAKRAAA